MNTRSRPASANLENPLYYLKNMETVGVWVANHHSDLLLEPELGRGVLPEWWFKTEKTD